MLAAPGAAAEAISSSAGEVAVQVWADDAHVRIFLVAWLILAVAIGIAVAVVPGVSVDGGVLTYLWIAALFAIVNLLLGPILRLLTAPLIIITLGLFAFVVNAVLFAITAWLSSKLAVDSFGDALLAALVISLVSWVLGIIVDVARRRERVA
jgi:putative membrane protein